MLITCKKCRKTAKGRYYSFHVGEVVDSKWGQHDVLFQRQTWIRTSYKVYGEAGAEICDHCATPKLGGKITVTYTILTVLLAVLIGFLAWKGLLAGMGTGFIIFFLLLLVPGATVGILGIMEHFGKGLVFPTRDTGEKAAISASSQVFPSGVSQPIMKFWTSKQYRELQQHRTF